MAEALLTGLQAMLENDPLVCVIGGGLAIALLFYLHETAPGYQEPRTLERGTPEPLIEHKKRAWGRHTDVA